MNKNTIFSLILSISLLATPSLAVYASSSIDLDTSAAFEEQLQEYEQEVAEYNDAVAAYNQAVAQAEAEAAAEAARQAQAAAEAQERETAPKPTKQPQRQRETPAPTVVPEPIPESEEAFVPEITVESIEELVPEEVEESFAEEAENDKQEGIPVLQEETNPITETPTMEAPEEDELVFVEEKSGVRSALLGLAALALIILGSILIFLSTRKKKTGDTEDFDTIDSALEVSATIPEVSVESALDSENEKPVEKKDNSMAKAIIEIATAVSAAKRADAEDTTTQEDQYEYGSQTVDEVVTDDFEEDYKPFEFEGFADNAENDWWEE